VANAIGQTTLQRIGEFECLWFYMKSLLIFITLTFLLSCEYHDEGLASNRIDSTTFIETRELLDINSRTLIFISKTEKNLPFYELPNPNRQWNE